MDVVAIIYKTLDGRPKKHGFIIGMRSDDQGNATFHVRSVTNGNNGNCEMLAGFWMLQFAIRRCKWSVSSCLNSRYVKDVSICAKSRSHFPIPNQLRCVSVTQSPITTQHHVELCVSSFSQDHLAQQQGPLMLCLQEPC